MDAHQLTSSLPAGQARLARLGDELGRSRGVRRPHLLLELAQHLPVREALRLQLLHARLQLAQQAQPPRRLRIGGGPFQAECEHLRAEQRRRRRVALAARAPATRGRGAVPLSLRLLRHARREGAELRALAVAEQTVTSLPRSNQPGAAPSALPSGLHLATSRRARHRASAASRRAACAGARSPRQAPKGRVAQACRGRVVDTARPSPSASAFWPDSRIGAYREGSETLPATQSRGGRAEA